MSAPPVTVVIPAWNAAATIDAQLDALARQDYPGPIAVIVADNGSTDDTVARAVAHTERIDGLQVVRASDRRGPAHARNVGIAAAATDLVLLCDADDLVDQAWVRELATALASADAVAGGTVAFREGPDATGSPQPFGQAGFGFLPGLMSASCGFRRAAWEAVGGFDESIPVATCEDIDFAWRLQLAGFQLVQAPQGFVHYREPRTAAALLRKWYRYGYYQPRLRHRFAADGLPRDPAPRVLAGWARLVLYAPRCIRTGEARRRWCRDAGRRAGRLVGSVRARTWYL